MKRSIGNVIPKDDIAYRLAVLSTLESSINSAKEFLTDDEIKSMVDMSNSSNISTEWDAFLSLLNKVG